MLRADIADFFGSISRSRIELFFESIGIQRQVAIAFGALTTIDDALGQGIHTSPLLANLICLDLDDDFQRLADDHDCRYTRYADDMSFSGLERFPSKLAIASVLSNHGFKLSPTKYRQTKLGQAHFVTGLSVSDSRRPRIPRNFRRNLRKELHYCGKFGIEEHAERAGYPTVEKCVNTIDGRISFFRSIEPDLGGQLHCNWQEVLERDHLRPTYGRAALARSKDIFLFVDESIWIDSAGKELLAIGVTLTEDAKRIGESVQALTGDILTDPFASGRKKKLECKGLHFTDDAEDTRTAFVGKIAGFPIRSFIAFSRFSDESSFRTTYLSSLKTLLMDRLAKQFNFFCHIVAEEHSQITTADISAVVDDVGRELLRLRRRPAFKPTVITSSKLDHPCLAVTDYILGVTDQFLTSPSSDIANKRFERLRDKIRLILDVNTGTRYWRKNPMIKGLLFKLADTS